VSVERLTVSRREVGHGGCLRVALVLEEDGEIGLDYVTKQAHKSYLPGLDSEQVFV
jgi:hypothetical protein